MDRWQKDWIQLFEATAKDAEQFLEDMAVAVEAVVDEIDQVIAELVEPLVDFCLGMESAMDEAAQPFVQTVQPVVQKHSVCMGCRNYHGQVYGGSLFVCAMHPYGAENDTCSDWQSTWEPHR